MTVTARGIAAGVIGAVAIGAFSLLATAQPKEDAAQDRARQPQERQQQQTERTGSADAVWGQVADLHRQIVRMEISPQSSTPAQPGQREGAARRGANQTNPQDRERADNQPGRSTDRTSAAGAGESRSDALWNQLGQKHAQLVQAKLKGEPDEGAGAERTTPGREGADADQPPRRQPAQPAQPGQRGQAASQTERLEREIGQLYVQILAVDLAEARGSRQALRPNLDDRSPSEDRTQSERPGTPRTPDRTPEN